MKSSTDVDVRLAKLEAIQNSAVDAIITIDQQGTIESANPATKRLFGYEIDELVGVNVNRLMPSPYHEAHDGYISSYLSTGIRKIIGIGREVVGLRKDGSTFPIHLAVSEIKVEGQRFFAGVVRDISDVKEVEQRLLNSERLAAIGQMVAGLAHESRNAFQRSHACLANLALDVREMPDSLDLVRKVQKALDDLNLILEEVRDYSAPIILKLQECDVADLVRETWQHVSAAKQFEMPEFKLCVNSEQVSCWLDAVRITQVLRNLLENAAYACKQLVEVSISTAPELICITVADDGTGIPVAEQKKVFDPFFTTKTKGTGLGLAISQRIVDAHQGRLSLDESHLGGAEFKIELPIKSKSGQN